MAVFVLDRCEHDAVGKLADQFHRFGVRVAAQLLAKVRHLIAVVTRHVRVTENGVILAVLQPRLEFRALSSQSAIG